MDVLHYGDLHYNKLDLLIPDVNRKIGAAQERVFEYALDNGITHIVQGGDVGDSPRLSYDAHIQFLKTHSKKRYRDLHFHFVLGNHDFAETGVHTLQIIEVMAAMLKKNIHVYTKATKTDLDGIPVQFLPHPYTSSSSKYHNFGHYEVKGSTGDSGREFKEGIENNHTCFNGHLHTPHRIRRTWYCGTLYQTNFGESLPKSFNRLILSEDPKNAEVQPIAFDPPWKLLNVTVNTPEDLKQLMNDSDIYYKLFLKDGLDIDLNQVLVNHPNVIRHNTFKSKKELSALIHQDWDLDGESVEEVLVDEEEVIRSLLGEAGLKKAQIALGMDIIKRIKDKSKDASKGTSKTSRSTSK